MDVILPIKFFKKIKFSLVFFCAFLLLTQCLREKDIKELVVDYDAGQAVAVSFKLRQAVPGLECYLSGQTSTPVLGALEILEDRYQFKPVVPFTDGQKYEIRSNGKLLTSFIVESDYKKVSGRLKAIYPSRDTVPENLLKIYLQFAQPMQEVGEVLNFIEVKDETTSKVVDVFLELETELWNKEHTRLTLWLDPGRIKTDLIPNLEKGLPLLEGHEYTIHISKNWKTAAGIPLTKGYSKKLVVTTRDSSKPNPEKWKILPPVLGQHRELSIDFNEALDAVLALESFTIRNSKGEVVAGEIVLDKKEERILFMPIDNWKKDTYTILIDAKLEDLAGNNLNSLFDTDMHQTKNQSSPQPLYRLPFNITE